MLVYMFLVRDDKLTMFFMCFTNMVSFTSSYDMTNCTLGLLSGNFSPDKTVEFQWVKWKWVITGQSTCLKTKTGQMDNVQKKHSSDNAESMILLRKLGWRKMGFTSNFPEPMLSLHIPCFVLINTIIFLII